MMIFNDCAQNLRMVLLTKDEQRLIRTALDLSSNFMLLSVCKPHKEMASKFKKMSENFSESADV